VRGRDPARQQHLAGRAQTLHPVELGPQPARGRSTDRVRIHRGDQPGELPANPNHLLEHEFD
jgi:hypothetical protein